VTIAVALGCALLVERGLSSERCGKLCEGLVVAPRVGGTPSSGLNGVIFTRTVVISVVWFAKLVFLSVLSAFRISSYNVTTRLTCVVVTVWIVSGMLWDLC